MTISIFVTDLVKPRSGFRVLDFQEAGIRDALVVAVKEDKEVHVGDLFCFFYLAILQLY